MALKALIESLEDVDEALREHYRPGTAAEETEGKFVLVAEGPEGWAVENVAGLKSALGRERSRADKAENKAKKFGDLDPDKAKQAIDRVAELEAIDPKKEADRLAQTKIEAATKQLIEKHTAEVKSVEEKANSYLGKVRSLLIDNVATAALAEHKGSIDLLLPHVLKHTKLKETDDGNFVVEVIDKEGNPRIGDAKGTPMTVGQLVAEMKQSDAYGRAFEGTGQSGSGKQPDKNAGGPGQNPGGTPKSWADAKTPEEKAAFLKSQKKE